MSKSWVDAEGRFEINIEGNRWSLQGVGHLVQPISGVKGGASTTAVIPSLTGTLRQVWSFAGRTFFRGLVDIPNRSTWRRDELFGSFSDYDGVAVIFPQTANQIVVTGVLWQELSGAESSVESNSSGAVVLQNQ